MISKIFKNPIIIMAYLFLGLQGCSPTVKIEAPDKPITVNLNVKVEHQIDVTVDQELESIIKKNPDIF